MIVKPSIPVYNYSEYVNSSEFHILEEELLFWSEASLEAPLDNDAFKRYMHVFETILPEKYRLL